MSAFTSPELSKHIDHLQTTTKWSLEQAITWMRLFVNPFQEDQKLVYDRAYVLARLAEVGVVPTASSTDEWDPMWDTHQLARYVLGVMAHAIQHNTPLPTAFMASGYTQYLYLKEAGKFPMLPVKDIMYHEGVCYVIVDANKPIHKLTLNSVLQLSVPTLPTTPIVKTTINGRVHVLHPVNIMHTPDNALDYDLPAYKRNTWEVVEITHMIFART